MPSHDVTIETGALPAGHPHARTDRGARVVVDVYPFLGSATIEAEA